MGEEFVKKGTIRVYGADWCGDCRRARRFFTQHEIQFEWIDIDVSDAARAFVKEVNHGLASIPTIVFEDGSTMTEPSLPELEARFHIRPN